MACWSIDQFLQHKALFCEQTPINATPLLEDLNWVSSSSLLVNQTMNRLQKPAVQHVILYGLHKHFRIATGVLNSAYKIAL